MRLDWVESGLRSFPIFILLEREEER